MNIKKNMENFNFNQTETQNKNLIKRNELESEIASLEIDIETSKKGELKGDLSTEYMKNRISKLKAELELL